MSGVRPISPRRRRLLAGLGGALTLAPLARCLASNDAHAQTPVVVVTAYPDEVMSRIEAAFHTTYPQYRLQFVWRMPNDALPYLLQDHQAGADVYWSASPRTYAALKQAGALRQLPQTLRTLPGRIGGAQIADVEGHFVATEVAGYGFAYDLAQLDALHLPVPADWDALRDPRYAGRVALPIPATVGFAPVMVDIVLQAYGWDAGWALWSEIAGNAQLVDRGASFVTDKVGRGDCAVGLSIDFFVASAIANGQPLRFAYPRHNGINPGQVAITTDAPNPEGAEAFTAFVLSEAGQRVLLHPDIRKLPARPGVYADAPAGYYNPYAAARAGGLDYNAARGQPRLALSAALFQQMWVEPHKEQRALWQRVHAAEAAGIAVGDARAALSAVPLSETQADALAPMFKRRLEGSVDTERSTLERRWARFAAQQRSIAARILDTQGAA
ncbi:ABC transporter substrate-binding protein [Sinimarinibacterium sp. CAU 1509]|uniref:ABC transporter substrate-binding protein n=1 Tax=Sinimarinibacterium sp. CAU 1509 TaxID=2562283 RepID=UPI0010ADA39B|nr:ABC transporter substrate-binding protein [Sinimarinibacterium sp. CAU 1509]TJY62815.1 ABC transporter substrate-binding protein [Sinimarinibacterium sp. CAU 1509]